jgi:asparagine synthase (glutamine-hydrolysing)
VLLILYALKKEACLKELRGMFAFAVWDDKEKSLFAARDRFGIKPFYYLQNNEEFIFSSELKAIKNYKKNLTISYKGIDAFLRTGSVPAPITIYNETKSLIPGHFIKISSKSDLSAESRFYPEKAEIKRWWSFEELLRDDDHGLGDIRKSKIVSLPAGKAGRKSKYDTAAKEKIRNSLLDTISAHMVSDVEVGAFLSGGIDSTAIVSLMRQVKHEKIKTISITFPGSKLDESRYSRLAAEMYKTDHYEYQLEEKEVIEDFNKILGTMDQPTIDGVNTYFVSKAAASFGLKVVLSGVGGDELFGGYPTFQNIPRIERLLKFKKLVPFGGLSMKLASKIAESRIPAKGIEFLREPDRPNAPYKLFRGLFTDSELRELGWEYHSPQTGQASIHPFNHSSDPDETLHSSMHGRMTPLQRVSYLESCFYMRNQLLRDSDVFSMAHSLELRVPFVDHILYSSVLPYIEHGYNPAEYKKVLAEGVEDLPPEIVQRPKMGFTFPFDSWMRAGKHGNAVKEDLMNGNASNPLSQNGIEKLFMAFESGRIHWSRVWALFVLNKVVRQAG